MNREEKEYNQLHENIKLMESKLKLVENLSDVKSYLAMKKDLQKLKDSEEYKYTLMKNKEYMNCKHLFVCTAFYKVKKGNTSRTYYDFGCLKCGLNTELTKYKDSELSMDEKINKAWCQSIQINGKVSLNIDIDLELATAIYNKIIKNYPDIDEDKIIKYLEIAADNMRNINVSDERKKSRIRRLNLSSDFYRW